ncbi:FMN-binding protein [Sebaldella termitidis]|uniref:Pyridoxamine 5'-phosphate oxidase-related FMN-binding protein n=1 Tax=Sebaldella termitidis (strain ATCC 33386 / NCTC 11300) TaxID=526218 RepID=D1APX8_SEBTE|nr:pyridoxamine 5'-phosphate oxidase family protein [Sebaldella termitidis]ACZ07556.1 pyridoxamine 5'-phosphate oxidase-related FMN- binding protein [Sebaldella termitidis ATCC 33386]SUI22852.1 FMN-binding protein [Sebaldella termitidis]
MFNEKFNEVLTKEGVVSITSWSAENVHVVNTWNSYLVKSGENKLLIPAAGMRKTQKNVEANSRVILTLGSKEVMGYKDYQGTGFVIEGTAKYLTSGEEFDMMKEKFPFLSRVLEITVESLKQTI